MSIFSTEKTFKEPLLPMPNEPLLPTPIEYIIRENKNIKNNDKSPEKTKQWQTTLNPNNTMVTPIDIQNILKIGNVTNNINNISIWQQSFTHKSYVVKNSQLNNQIDNFNSLNDSASSEIHINILNENMIPLQPKSNERLEWLGDAKIQDAVSYYLWERYPDQDEGFLTKLRSKLVKTNNLAFLADKINLSKYLLISYHVEFGCQGRVNQRILENTFEAFIGAMYIDFSNNINPSYGNDRVREFIINIIEKYVDIEELVIKDENSKDQLMWYFQKRFNGAYPIYIKERYENEYFYINIYEPNTTIISGRGNARTKKQAEQNAAKNALLYYAKKDMDN